MTARAVAVRRAGDWPDSGLRGEVVFDYDRRHRRRMKFMAADVGEILLDLPDAVHVRDGDAFELEGGGFIRVRAVPEAVLEVAAPDADTLARLAWHLGNRHLAVQFLPGRLRILDDHVIAGMIAQMGGQAERVMAPFDPEPGAYHHG
ncbi:MAG: urease accessory protein UreE [Acidocella sp.]|nr:urease accessory protein UreE [Acidocella sp.]